MLHQSSRAAASEVLKGSDLIRRMAGEVGKIDSMKCSGIGADLGQERVQRLWQLGIDYEIAIVGRMIDAPDKVNIAPHLAD